ncbi:MAG: endolytic transglycosylase MltG [Alphaproteobacteria bacterium]|nr:endolytic transglycosylase MltG [Alphaproteobacteria bacterium]
MAFPVPAPSAPDPRVARRTVPEPFIPPSDVRRIRPLSPRAALEPEPVRVPTKASKTARHPLVIAGNAVITALLLAVIAGGIILGLVKNRLDAAGPLPADKIVNVPPRLGIRDIADLLVKEGVIENPSIFIVMALPAKMRDQLKFGEYQFQRQASLHDVINTIVEGKWVQHPLTIAEGLTSEQVVQRVLEADFLAGNIKEIPHEGSLLPETYRFTRGTLREKAIQQMQQAQQRMVKEIWDRRLADLPLRSMEQMVTLASIVEKETGRGDERSRVAAVFVNRLKQKMKLQSDPTIIYGLVGGKGTLGRPILRSEIEQPTPYNTYVIDGLPPGPIANPGRAALEAVANPARTKELYFVADGGGGHVFSETLEQHQRGVARLRALERGDSAAAAEPVVAPAPVAAAPAPVAPRRTTQAPRAQQPTAARAQ